MPGLLVAISLNGTALHRPALAEAIRLLCHDGRFQARGYIHASAGFALTQVIGSKLGHHSYESQDLVVWVYGAVYPRGATLAEGYDETRSADYVAEQYRKHQLRTVDHLNGEFNVALYDKRQDRLVIINDRHGVRPWYLGERQGSFVLSSEIKGMKPFIGAFELDYPAALCFLAFKKSRLSYRTLVKGVTILPPASLPVIDFQAREFSRTRYWQAHYNDSTDPSADLAALDNVIACYRSATQLRCQPRPDRRVGISLSGGLDSRTIVGALSKEQRTQISTHAFGMLESDEVRIAQEVAKAMGLLHYTYEITPADYVSYARRLMWYSDEVDMFVQGGQIRFLEQASQLIDVLAVGVLLGPILGAEFITDEYLSLRTEAEAIKLMMGKMCLYSPEEMKSSLVMGHLHKHVEEMLDVFWDEFRQTPQDNLVVKCDAFINHFGAQLVMMQRYALNRFYFETTTPTFDYDFVDEVSQLPVRQRIDRAATVKLLKALSEELVCIPYQRTMLPPVAPRKYWSLAVRLEQEREQMYLDIWRDTHGQTYIPYTRHYTNYDEWLRIDPDWIQLTDDLLRNPNAAIYEIGLAQPSYVAELINQHRAAQRNNRQRLILLMSLELYLQEYFVG